MPSIKEKIALQRIIVEQNKILADAPGVIAKLKAQRTKFDALAQLGKVSVSANAEAVAVQDEDQTALPDAGTSESVVAVSGEVEGERVSTSHHFDFDPNRKPAQRKRENTAAMALIRQIESGDIDGNTLTDEQKTTLAKYSGLGGALVGIDGQKGSAYEYYTPKPIAQGVWDLAKELGFTGGKVLDPSAGVGIFGATAPESAVVDAVELDKTSGLVNKLVNGGVGSNIAIAPFEQVAASTPDGEYDMVCTNVPFGDNTSRGANKMFDKRYQKESLQSYFILRSLEKLKPGGLAVFIVPPGVVSGRVGKDESLRSRACFMAEFLGAYRLPNTVFGTAQADTITDVIAFRKYDKTTAEKIAELKEQSPDTLITANVQWQPFIDGQYFKGEGKRFVLGEFIPKIEGDKFSRDQIVSNASVGEIGKMLRKFPGSRVDWALLDATETEAIVYNDGDIITQAGQTLQWTNGKWVALAQSHESADMANSLADIANAYTAFAKKVTYDTATKIRDYMVAYKLTLDMPGWFKDAMYQVERSPASDRQKHWNAGVIGLSCAQVLEERLSEETGVNYLEEYAELSEAMQRVASTAKNSTSKIGGDLKQGLLKIGHHYNVKTGFSPLWRGDVLQSVVAAETTHDASFDGLLYRNKSAWAAIEEAKVVYGDDFDPLTDSKWCISSDGKQVTRADDYYTGSYAAFIKRMDADIAAATDDAVIAKLLRQKLDADKYLDKVDVKSLSFNLFSPHVTHEEKAEFLRKFGYPAAAVIYDEKTGDKRVDIDVKINKNSTDRDKLANRFGDYMKNGTISLGGAKLGMSDINALRELRRMVNAANEQFNGWAAANAQITNRLENKANSPALLTFKQADDEEAMNIPGMNPELVLHGYQNSFVRKMGRDFSGINGFAVGLGKTFSALAAVQYAQAIGVKKKTLFVVPNSVLSNWKKETSKAYLSTEDCLYVGLRTNAKGKEVVNSAFIDSDLSSVMENRHSKIYVTFETFERIKLRESTITEYENYLGSIDSNYKTSLNVKEREEANSKKAGLVDILSNKTGAAPFLEDLGIDSVVMDEAHAYKNSSRVFDFKSAKFLSLGNMAKRGIDAQCKAWYIRGQSPRADGILMLTATPITNSPLEIYSMLSLAKGHDKVNSLMLGINGADDFMNMMTDIANEDDVTIDGIDRTTNVFVGLNNVDVLRRAIDQSSTVKSAKDVGAQVALPDADDKTSTVALTDATIERLQLYKDAFRWAIDDLSNKKDNRGDANAYQAVADYFGENQKLIAHPFNLINKMTLLIADPELDRRATFFTIAPGNLDKAKAVIEAFNKKKIIEKRPRTSPFTESDAVVGRKITTDDETGDQVEMLSIEVRAMLQPDNKTIVIDTMDSQTQLRWDEMADKAELDLDVSIPPKLAALLENIQFEQTNPRGKDSDGNKSPIVKQIIFSDILAMHSKIKRLLAKKAGIKSSHIAIITGKTNNTPDEIMSVQDGFNAHGEDNKYRIIIANEKAEVGINLQQGTQAIHHLSIGWTPDSLTQRNGRGVRQGNKTKKVAVYTYDADGTFDAIKRDMVDKKAGWIENVMKVGGDNKVQISGGLSKEQLESLIDVTGDKEAMTKIQESVSAKEAEARATTNLAKQKVNIDTIKKQRAFIDANDPVTDFVIPKIANLWTIREQITMIQARINNPKATATAIVKNEAILSELQAKEQGIVKQISESVTIASLSGPYNNKVETIISVDQAIANYKNGYAKGNRYNAEGLSDSLGSTYSYKITVTEGSPMHTEWVAEIDMAKSMIDSALNNFSQQAKQPGSIPAEVGVAFAEGKGFIKNDHTLTVGTFLRTNRGLGIIFSDNDMKYIVGTKEDDYGFSANADDAFILPGSAGYEACLIDAAKLEDASGLNTYSEIVPEVTQYRTTARVKEYNAGSFQLPQPHFPHVFCEERIKGSALLQSIYDAHNEIIIERIGCGNGSRITFKVAYDVAVEPFTGNFFASVIAYARAHNVQAAWNMDADYWFSDAVKKELIATFAVDDEGELQALLTDKTDIESISQTFIDFVKGKVNYVDFTGATSDDVKQLVPFNIGYAYTKAKNDAERNAERAAQAKTPFDENVQKLFDFAKNDEDGHRLIAMIKTSDAAIKIIDQQNQFARIYRMYKAINRKTIGDDFFNEVDKDVNALFDKFKATIDTVQAEVAQPINDPEETVAIVGDTMNWKGTIKLVATQHGDGKFKWDGKNKAWNVKRKTWISLIEGYPRAKNELNIITATLRLW
ncbi:MAG: SNF2-related protein [Methylococcaceae bacterium]|jgi:SNF2 family DNA or RNA helicase